jgi:hypothetical protein
VRFLYRLLGFSGDVKAARRGPGAYLRRRVRARGHREAGQVLRRVLRP